MNTNARTEARIRYDLGWAARILRSYLMTVDNQLWVTQGTIAAETGLTGVTVRQVCNAFPLLVVSSTLGYKLSNYATPRQIQASVASLTNRSIKMLVRARALSTLLAA